MVDLQEIKQVIALVVNVPLERISDSASMDDIEEWDSLAQMNLVLALEEEYEVVIPDEEVGTMISLPLIYSLLVELTN
jgi:acyl carrier protein